MAITTNLPTTDRFQSLFEDVFGPAWGGRLGSTDLLGAPRADVVEGSDWIRVMVDVPGMSPGDIDVSLENNILTVSGEKKEDEEGEESPRWHLSERRYGRFSRSFTLPRDVEHDQIEARLDNGVLELTVPKSETARPRRIQIRNGRKRKRILGGS